MDKFPPAPKNLSPETRKWWNELVRRFDFEFHHLRILQAAAESWDVYQKAQRVLEKRGLSYEDQRGVFHPRPEVAIARDARIAFLRSMRELSLSEAEAEAPRPPTIPGRYEHG